LNEHHLITQVVNGDKASFRYLYRLHALSALQLANSICKQKELAEEVVQNSFIHAFKYLHSFRFESSFKTWLLRIVFNEALRIQKAEKKYQWQEFETDEFGEDKISISYHNQFLHKETKEQVAKTILQLNEKESLVLTLFYIEELSIKETAEILGFSEGNVKVLLHRARKNFKLIYEKQ
jgi:RNA polymerase sigma factor (sigma-70 family)